MSKTNSESLAIANTRNVAKLTRPGAVAADSAQRLSLRRVNAQVSGAAVGYDDPAITQPCDRTNTIERVGRTKVHDWFVGEMPALVESQAGRRFSTMRMFALSRTSLAGCTSVRPHANAQTIGRTLNTTREVMRLNMQSARAATAQDHSERSATSGSTRVARRVGM